MPPRDDAPPPATPRSVVAWSVALTRSVPFHVKRSAQCISALPHVAGGSRVCRGSESSRERNDAATLMHRARPRLRQCVRCTPVDSAELGRSCSVRRPVDAGHRQLRMVCHGQFDRLGRHGSSESSCLAGEEPVDGTVRRLWSRGIAPETRPVDVVLGSAAWNKEARVRSARGAPRAISRSQLRRHSVLALITARRLPARSLLLPGRHRPNGDLCSRWVRGISPPTGYRWPWMARRRSQDDGTHSSAIALTGRPWRTNATRCGALGGTSVARWWVSSLEIWDPCTTYAAPSSCPRGKRRVAHIKRSSAIAPPCPIRSNLQEIAEGGECSAPLQASTRFARGPPPNLRVSVAVRRGHLRSHAAAKQRVGGGPAKRADPRISA